jgi:hypothetical protein
MVDLIAIVDMRGRVRIYLARGTMLSWRAHLGNKENIAVDMWS